MFQLIVSLFMVVNGAIAEQPSGQLVNRMKFETEKACMEYLGSEAGASSRLFIEDMVDESKGKLAVKYMCVSNTKQDDTI